jgi:sulfate permease, SulP family
VRDQVKRTVGASGEPPHAVILDIGANGTLDITSSETLTALATTLHSAGVDFALAEVHAPVLEVARRSGLIEALGDSRVFGTVGEAVRALDGAGR